MIKNTVISYKKELNLEKMEIGKSWINSKKDSKFIRIKREKEIIIT